MSDETIVRKPTIIKLEVEIHPTFHRLIINPRDSESETLASIDALYHALLSSQPKRARYLPGSPGFVVDVKNDDTDTAV